MKDAKNITESSESEIATFLSILREPKQEGRSLTSDTFSILPYFVGHLLLPPHLPRFSAKVQRNAKDDILSMLNSLSKLYDRSYADHELTPEEADDVKGQLVRIGDRIATYISGFGRMWRYIEREYHNLIIVTNEPDIPWTLACRPGWGEEPEFLCNQFSCGIILVGEGDKALIRLEESRSRGFLPLRLEARSGEPRVVLIAASSGDGTSEDDPFDRYVSRLEEFFTRSPYFRDAVRCIRPHDWAGYSGDPEALVAYLARHCRAAQIIHFTGHVVEGKMRFDNNTRIGARELRKLDLPSRPLVVLHGCSSGRGAPYPTGEGELYRAFLDRDASGCLATLLPVNISGRPGEGTETVIELFYKEVMNEKPYGMALRLARERFMNPSTDRKDPQGLFYVLYGDPRAKLLIPRHSTKDILWCIEREEFEQLHSSLTPHTLEITLEGGHLDEEELLALIGEADWVTGIKKQPLRVGMAFPPEALSALHTVYHFLTVGVVHIGPPLLAALGKTIVEKIAKKIGTKVQARTKIQIKIRDSEGRITQVVVESPPTAS